MGIQSGIQIRRSQWDPIPVRVKGLFIWSVIRRRAMEEEAEEEAGV